MDKTIIKRIAPVLTSALALSALYTTSSLAGSNTIPFSDVMLGDDVTISAGYYENDTIVNVPSVAEVIGRGEIDIDDLIENNAVAGIDKASASYYADGNNEHTYNPSDGDNTDVSLSQTEGNEINLGNNEQIVLPKGYYFQDTTIKNSVANRTNINISDYISGSNVSLPDGFYNEAKLAEIYNHGVLNGGATGFAGAEVTYHLVHQHVDGAGNLQTVDDYIYSNPGGCFTRAESYTYYTTESYVDTWTEWTDNDSGSGHKEYIEHHEVRTRQVPHTGTRYACTCGHTFHDEEPDTNDYDSIKPTQLIKGVEVELF